MTCWCKQCVVRLWQQELNQSPQRWVQWLNHRATDTQTVAATDLPVVNVCLTAVYDSYNAEPHWDNSATQYVNSVRAVVHEIKLRNHR